MSVKNPTSGPLLMGARGAPSQIKVSTPSSSMLSSAPVAAAPRVHPQPQTTTATSKMSAEDLAQKKKMVEMRLREKERRLSRLSQAISGNPNAKQAQHDINNMSEKLRKMQLLLERNEQSRKTEELEEQKRQQEEEKLKRLTKELENQVAPGTLTRSQKARRTQNLKSLIISVDGKITQEALELLEQKEKETDEKEKRERQEKLKATESRLKEINNRLRDHARQKEEQNLHRLQRQLELMESKLKDYEDHGQSSGGGADEEDEEAGFRDWEEQNKQLRIEKEKAMQRKRTEMDKRLRELQETVEEKRREREQKLEVLRSRKQAALEAELKDLERPIEDDVVPYTPAARPPGSAMPEQFDDWMKRIVDQRLAMLESQMQKRRELDEAEHRQKQQELDRKLREVEEREKRMINGGGGGGGGGGGSGGGGVDISDFEKLKKMVDMLSRQVAAGGGGGGNNASSVMSYEELMKEIAETQRIIFDDTSKENEIAEANIKLEKLMEEYEKTPEYRAQKEEKRQANEKLNKAALDKVRTALRSLGGDELKRRVTDSPELKLLFMDPNAIMKLHQNDFKQYALRGLSYEELRALRGCLPTFKNTQQVQIGWQESIESKIEEMASSADKPKPPPKKASGGAKKWKKAPSAAKAAGGDLFSEILARGKKAGGGGSDDSGPPAPVAKMSLPPSAPKKMPPLPPPGPPGGAPPPPPPPGVPPPPPPPSFGGSPPPPPPPFGGSPPPPPPPAKTMNGSGATNANGIKKEVDDLAQMVFSGEAEADVVKKCKFIGEQIKVLTSTGDYKELAPKARFFILAIKESMGARNGNAQEVAKAKQKLLVVVKSLKGALD